MENCSFNGSRDMEEHGTEPDQQQQQQQWTTPQNRAASPSLPQLQQQYASPSANIPESDESPPSYELRQAPHQLSVAAVSTALPSYEYSPPTYSNHGFVCFPPPSYSSAVDGQLSAGDDVLTDSVFYCRLPPPGYSPANGAVAAAAAAAGGGNAASLRQPGRSRSSRLGKQSFFWHVTVACLVFWACGWIFGAIAFVLAVVATSTASSGDRVTARKLGQASAITSTIGVLFGVFVWGFIAWSLVVMSTATNGDGDCSSHGNRPYACDGRCYANSMHGNERMCHMMPSSCFLDGFCYFNA